MTNRNRVKGSKWNFYYLGDQNETKKLFRGLNIQFNLYLFIVHAPDSRVYTLVSFKDRDQFDSFLKIDK